MLCLSLTNLLWVMNMTPHLTISVHFLVNNYEKNRQTQQLARAIISPSLWENAREMQWLNPLAHDD